LIDKILFSQRVKFFKLIGSQSVSQHFFTGKIKLFGPQKIFCLFWRGSWKTNLKAIRKSFLSFRLLLFKKVILKAIALTRSQYYKFFFEIVTDVSVNRYGYGYSHNEISFIVFAHGPVCFNYHDRRVRKKVLIYL